MSVNAFGAIMILITIAAGVWDCTSTPITSTFMVLWGVGWGAYYTHKMGWFNG